MISASNNELPIEYFTPPPSWGGPPTRPVGSAGDRALDALVRGGAIADGMRDAPKMPPAPTSNLMLEDAPPTDGGKSAAEQQTAEAPPARQQDTKPVEKDTAAPQPVSAEKKSPAEVAASNIMAARNRVKQMRADNAGRTCISHVRTAEDAVTTALMSHIIYLHVIATA